MRYRPKDLDDSSILPNLCDVNTTERPVLMMSRIRFHKKRRAFGSIPVVGSSCKNQQKHLIEDDGCYRYLTMVRFDRSDQKDKRGVSNQSDGCGEFAFVASTICASGFVGVLGQLQFLQSPLNHLQDTHANQIS